MKIVNKNTRNKILSLIWEMYPYKKIELHYSTDFQLLIAVILSAQMTDIWVNKVTKKLFEKIKKPSDMKNISISEIEVLIRSINYYKTKQKHIHETGIILEKNFQGKIPKDIEKITTLPGVGIKTAKVVLAVLYDMPYLAVDTHVHRVMNRMKIVSTKTPKETDKKISQLLTEDQKKSLHHAIVLFGRYICTAKNCKCSETKLKNYCHCKKCKEIRKNHLIKKES